MQLHETQSDSRLTFTVDEVASLLGLSRATAYKAVNNGSIPAIKIGHRTLVPRASLLRWLEAAAVTSECRAA
jgi:excisionase family DNA binding protein